MRTLWLGGGLVVGTLISGVLGGIFMAFSDVVMRSLAKASQGAEAMQIINREVFTSVFGVLLWTMLAIALSGMAYACLHWQARWAAPVLVGGIFYGVGVGVVSGMFNVPMNHVLEALDWRQPETTAYFQDSFVPQWKFWNHVRTLSCMVTSVCFLFAAVLV
ncbi:MAG: anthrone oxygenase family protein [Pseudomonadota bacterium]